MKPIRVLVVGMTDAAGGVENFLMAYCGRIDPRRVRFDFLTRYEDAVYREQRSEIGKTYVLPMRSKDPVRYYREIRSFFDAHAKEYDIIWDNECMFNDLTPLQLAAEHEIPVRIAHSHNPRNDDPSLAGKGRGILHRGQRRMLSRYANVLWACSEESAKWACPAMDLPVSIIPHAVDAASLRYSETVRAQVRAHYGLTDCLVVGHVGRMHYQKNHPFLLEAFVRLHQREPRARLVLAGDGPDLLALEAKAVSLGISEAVLFLGQRDDVPRLLQALDLFVMPSHFEGLGMAAVEAQAAGLPCILSSSLPREAAITEDVTFLPPDDPDLWAERMLDTLEGLAQRQRPDTLEMVKRAGYELNEAVERLTQRFEKLAAEKPGFKRRFLLTGSPVGKVDQAAKKLRDDVRRIAQAEGFACLESAVREQGDKWWQQALMMGRSLWEWGKLFFKLHHGDLLMLQYPWYPVKTAPIARYALHMLQWKGAKTAAYIHDLPSLRELNSQTFRWSDQELLKGFDRLIVQHARMGEYLRGQGMTGKVITAPLQPWLADGSIPERTLTLSVCFAGNLTRKRNQFLHDIPKSKIQWHLYGEGWKGKAGRTDLLYHGSGMDAMEGSLGLCWEGPDLRRCRGAAGAYMMLTAPRELSCYLAQGMPVIVWKWSAMADYVREHSLGLVIDSLTELPAVLEALTEADYARMAAAARDAGERLRRGDFTREALEKL